MKIFIRNLKVPDFLLSHGKLLYFLVKQRDFLHLPSKYLFMQDQGESG